MADKPCRWLYLDLATAVCEHPLLMFHDQGVMELDRAKMYGGGSVSGCHGCPCHEPQPDPRPNGTCRWWKDEYGNWCCACSDTLPDFTPWPGTDPNGCFCPKCGKIITVRVHDKP